MIEYPLSESFEVNGDWFVPENTERKIAGLLYYTPEQTELYLNDPFQPLLGSIRADNSQEIYPVVYGISSKGEAMTLLEAQRSSISINSGSGGIRQPEKLISHWLIIGAHVPIDYVYSKIGFRIPALQVWYSQPIIDQIISKEQNTGRFSQTFHVLPFNNNSIPIPSIDSTIEWGISCNSSFNPFSCISVNVSAWITIKPTSPQAIKWYFDQFGKLSVMLAFLAGSPMSPDCIEAYLDDHSHKVFALVALSDVHYCSYKNPHNFFMIHNAMGIDLEKVVTHWFEIYPKVDAPSQLALSILASEGLWLHIKFLLLMQALEGFHRNLFEGDYMDEDNYEEVKKALYDAIPAKVTSDHKSSLRSRIKYGNQFSLQKRLNDLANRLSESLRTIILGGDGKIPRSWIDTRNFYTHWDEELRPNILDPQDMYYANVRMQHFLRVLYLDLMGIPQAAIIQSLGNASEISQQLAQLNSIDRHKNDTTDTSGVIMTITERQNPVK